MRRLKIGFSLPIGQYRERDGKLWHKPADRFKPCSKHTMIAEGHDILRRQSRVANLDNYREILFKEVDIFRPSPPLQQVNSLLSMVPVDLRKLGTAGQEGTGLVEEAIRLCNSSLFGLARPVSTLEQAVVATDADLIRTLLLTCWLTKLTGSKVATQANQMFWSHGLLVSQFSRRIGEWAGLAQPEWAFLAGLLHDAGALPFLTLLSRDGTAEHQNIFLDLGDCIESQRSRFGTDHCELGQKLNAILDFPLPVAEAIARHHQRKTALSRFPLLSIVGCAEAISQVCYHCSIEELRGEGIENFIKDMLRAWLPGLNPSASLPLLGALKSDLVGTTGQLSPDAIKAWSGSFSAPGIQAGAQTTSGIAK